MIREKLAERLLQYFPSPGVVPSKYTDTLGTKDALLIADQQIAIFKEMLDTMELPKYSYSWAMKNVRHSGDEYFKSQQDLLKAIKEEYDKE